ncbi:spermidine/putrescine ABC transporter substrate-binding protein [Aetokthonos hydrillicola Thurmond2011]|jgi:spermidine/putrescine transport system substrate-binding protein|uniref:Spermidine/putrescine ABC transporter substrate-binding protein n=1 Tax=Aetokthonos hydrillicola Thurmond2011 TaxID=2712845 RepID=A0AAP5I7G6_9CYAN|nr:spermidine/putrescine ABC transporter substrate-binding protein [Aetokthonos hydrillicola]MBO3458785.1 spermidine/putrescine ABC transporter substrate-binding protein [Aetokthonos hydrillicola CCALA 1050]MBW4585532.1 spermidine/putrescine ABC transporter substrate-binding protein [Aetokthonos hydrillicola CCALA 1050]MDR9896155.1 spermidine/putrescine ABC transporter substrate-binding protein [Aetokthonos hydrillicola Thurmond2011]
MIKRRQLVTGIAALSTLSTAGCGWRLADVRATSKNRGSRDQLNLYTWTQYFDKELLTTFTAQTGLKVLADVYDSNDIMLAKLQAGGGGAYSVIYPSDYMVQKMVNKGLLNEINHARLIGLDNLLPRFQNPTYDSNNRYSIPFNWGTTGLIFNSEVLKNPPEDWEYLWQHQEQLSKRMTLINDVREVMGAVLRMLGYSYNSRNENEIKQAYEKLKVLKGAIAAFDTDAWRNQIVAGDLLLAMCYSADGVKLSQEYPKFKYIIPKSGSSLWTDTIVIPKTAPNLDGAYAWINFILQPEVAARMSQRLSIATPNQAGFDLLPKKFQKNVSLFPPESVLDKCERITPLGKIEEVYERYWTELTSS